ncbi:MAG TPA: hypothetical protein VGL58_14565 [Caulobacteraceae bacterium]|jgi:hypothetical protein
MNELNNETHTVLAAAAQSEAEAESEETILPWIWFAIGLAVIAAFVATMMFVIPHGHTPPNPPAAAPLIKPPGQHT